MSIWVNSRILTSARFPAGLGVALGVPPGGSRSTPDRARAGRVRTRVGHSASAGSLPPRLGRPLGLVRGSHLAGETLDSGPGSAGSASENFERVRPLSRTHGSRQAPLALPFGVRRCSWLQLRQYHPRASSRASHRFRRFWWLRLRQSPHSWPLARASYLQILVAPAEPVTSSLPLGSGPPTFTDSSGSSWASSIRSFPSGWVLKGRPLNCSTG